MTLRLRPTAPARKRRSANPEDRYQFWVTIGFITLIVAVIAILLVSVAISYYNDHLKPIASIGGQNISPDDWAQRIRLESFRLSQEEGRLRQEIASNPDNASALQGQLSDIQAKEDTQTVATQAANDLVDLTFKQQLAGQNSVTVTDATVDAQQTKDASDPEQRHVLLIAVEPQAATAGATPTSDDIQVAYDNAQKAAAALAVPGADFASVAKQYSTDASASKGGDIGFIDTTDATDATWDDAIFRLPQGGTTPVIKGDDGTYRIGRVTEIKPGTEDPSFTAKADDAVGQDYYRGQLRLEALAEALDQKITADQLATAVDQYKLDEIKVAINGTDPTSDVQIKAAHILYSPNHDPSNQASLPPDDPAWATAKAAAQKTADELNSITDISQREARFAEIAKSESDDTSSGANGGELGTFTADQMVPAFSDALFKDPDLKPGDIVGPVQSEFGYHVILFEDRVPTSSDRLAQVKAALAIPGADFAAIAKEFSDGDQALQGGELGWQVGDQLPPEVLAALQKITVGQTTDSVQTADAFYIEKLEDKAQRPPDGQAAAQLASTAFDTWYATEKTQAVKDDDIQTDKDIFTTNDSSGSGASEGP
jgi:parvulin-like peptidyl-prolyl isomerase